MYLFAKTVGLRYSEIFPVKEKNMAGFILWIAKMKIFARENSKTIKKPVTGNFKKGVAHPIIAEES